MLRDYQQNAHDEVIEHLKKSLEPCLIEAPTGAGKSHIIAAIAKTLYSISKKRILCLAPSKELVQQNHAKYLATGNQASIYSASITKSLRYAVVFGTPLSVKNDLKRFKDQFCAVIVDEAHRTTKSIIDIIDKLRLINDKLRVIGLTATPQRMGEGLIYGDDKFYTLVYSISPYELMERGYLCKTQVIYPSDDNYYSTINFKIQKTGFFKSSDLYDIEVSHEKTANIVHDVVMFSENKPGKTLIFASTVKHAMECYNLLPSGKAILVTASSKNRDKDLYNFKTNKEIKYAVNMQVLTTGFDAPNIDVIALLRPTESKSLLQQMIGRGLRTLPGKELCWVLDYAENIKRHCHDEKDIFSIQKEEDKTKKSANAEIEVACPQCNYKNLFTIAPNPDKLKISNNGYFMTLLHEQTDIPAHYGRRCGNLDYFGQQCDYRWHYKECHICGQKNDYAARLCEKCNTELINPDDGLKHVTFSQKVDIKSIEVIDSISKKGNPIKIAKFISKDDKEIKAYFMKTNDFWFKKKLSDFERAYQKGIKSINYELRKGFINITDYL